MKSVLKLCIVNRGNGKNIYSKNDATMYIRSYSDLEDTGKYAQLASWSPDHDKTGSWEEETQFPSPHSFTFPSLGKTHEVHLIQMLQGGTHPCC